MRYLIGILLSIAVCVTCFGAIVDEYLVDLGKSYFDAGYLNEARIEFEKALRSNPNNIEAKQYLGQITQRKSVGSTLDKFARPQEVVSLEEEIIIEESPFVFVATPEPVQAPVVIEERAQVQEEIIIAPATMSTRQEAIDEALGLAEVRKPVVIEEKMQARAPAVTYAPAVMAPMGEEPAEEHKYVKGYLQASMGVESNGDVFWQRANWDLNEMDWRLLSKAAWNNQFNTYDPAVYQQIVLKVDTPPENNWGFHTYIDASPWSFVGKSEKTTVMSTGGDVADIQLLYWSNTGHTLNQTVFTNINGDTFNLPEIKVKDWRTVPTTITSAFSDTLTIPELEIERVYWPAREFWVDYNTDAVNLRVYPVALQDQAYQSDDILELSDHRIYWEESPWLTQWKQGHFNSAVGAQDYSSGYFDDSLAWISRNSRGEFLTNLRGFELSLNNEMFDFDFAAATPKNLWQDYEDADTVNGVTRMKYRPIHNLQLGLIGTAKLGLNDDDKADAWIRTGGTDITYGMTDNAKLAAEFAYSETELNETSDVYKREKNGNALKVSFIHSSEGDVFDKTFWGLKPDEESQDPFYRLRVDVTHMDDDFETGLSTYLRTRDDMFWSRHIHFGQPFGYYTTSFFEPTLTPDDIEPFAIGDGIDYGRNVVHLRIDGRNYKDGDVDYLLDSRHVRRDDLNKHLETVSRLEMTWRFHPQWTLKTFGLYQDKPKTRGGIDPYIIDVKTGEYLPNVFIQDGQDADLETHSAGLEYKVTKNVTVHGIYEYTNDSTLAYDNFPRGLFTGGSMTTFVEDGKTYRTEFPFTYSQFIFPQPPYDFYNIYKGGLDWNVFDGLRLGFDYTHNDYKWAGPIDNNMNHAGVELEFKPNDKFSFFTRYVYSIMNDVNRFAAGDSDISANHHNFFAEVALNPTPTDSLVLQYGVYTHGYVGELLFDPWGGTMTTLDTQHLARIYYRKKF